MWKRRIFTCRPISLCHRFYLCRQTTLCQADVRFSIRFSLYVISEEKKLSFSLDLLQSRQIKHFSRTNEKHRSNVSIVVFKHSVSKSNSMDNVYTSWSGLFRLLLDSFRLCRWSLGSFRRLIFNQWNQHPSVFRVQRCLDTPPYAISKHVWHISEDFLETSFFTYFRFFPDLFFLQVFVVCFSFYFFAPYWDYNLYQATCMLW